MAIREFKNDVKAVVDYLAQSGIQVQHTVMLEAISKGFGERGWSVHREALAALTKAGDTVVAQGETVSPPAWRYEDGPMSDAQYVARKGTHCPVCGSDHIDSESIEADGKDGWANVRCRECDASWSDSWQLTGYFDLDTPQAVAEPIPEAEELYADGEFVSIWDGGQFVSNARISLSNGIVDEIERVDVPDAIGRLVREEFRLANVPGAAFTLENVNGDYLVEPGAILTMRRLLKVERPTQPAELSLSATKIGADTLDAVAMRKAFSSVRGTFLTVLENGEEQEMMASCLLNGGRLIRFSNPESFQNMDSDRIGTSGFFPSGNIRSWPFTIKEQKNRDLRILTVDDYSLKNLNEWVEDKELALDVHLEIEMVLERLRVLSNAQQLLEGALWVADQATIETARAAYGDRERQEHEILSQIARDAAQKD